MAVYHGKDAKILAWDGNNTAHSSEACTIDGNTAQITASTKRILDPNETQTFTDGGGKNVIEIDYTIGKATFDGTPSSVTADGKHVVVANLDLMANMHNWTIEETLDTAEASPFGSTSKLFEAGLPGWGGSAEGYFLNSTWKDAFDLVKLWFVRFHIDGTHYFQGWCHITGLSGRAAITEIVGEPLSFQGYGMLHYA
jgi:hypothetical protein